VTDRVQGERVWAVVTASPLLGPLVQRWDEIALPDCWLVAGAVAQTVWNAASGLPATHGISDIDLVYFDTDLSEACEQAHAERVRALLGLDVWIDVKNEARVHLWYEAKFGKPLKPYVSTRDAISTFPTTATAVGVRPAEAGFEIAAPYGLDDLLGLIVRANKKQVTRDRFDAKIARWRPLWPKLRIIEWDEA
jgi:hypothetical protein